jgi:hypothetical protein
MTTQHAWFSSAAALLHGSAVYRKADGSTVNVTRRSGDRESKDPARQEENYVGEVLDDAEGGCVRATWRARSIVG